MRTALLPVLRRGTAAARRAAAPSATATRTFAGQPAPVDEAGSFSSSSSSPSSSSGAAATASSTGKGGMEPFTWNDALALDGQLTEEEKMVRDTAADYCQNELLPRVVAANRHETFDRNIMSEFGSLGLLGATIKSHGCSGVGYVSYGLIAREVERVDSGYRSAMSVQSSLVMHPIDAFGSDEQKDKVRRGEDRRGPERRGGAQRAKLTRQRPLRCGYLCSLRQPLLPTYPLPATISITRRPVFTKAHR